MNKMNMSNKRTYRKPILFGAFVLGFLALGVASLSAQTTGELTLRGTVPEILEITVNAEPGSDSLDLTIDVQNLKVATVVERSNKKLGYTVTLESANAAATDSETGIFSNEDPEVRDQLAYSLSYGGEAVSFSGGNAIISDVSEKTSGQGSSKELAISYNGASEFPYEGTYSDTLTFTISAK
ncbi:MAG TPA: hypothetical protein ENN41_07695 [Sediminispirochaeta sp.]|nr:hypothetical protein [Sediminispirochaeta sp.]